MPPVADRLLATPTASSASGTQATQDATPYQVGTVSVNAMSKKAVNKVYGYKLVD